MSTIVFVEMTAFGHVNPSLPIARELVRRGERVIYYDDIEFQPVVEAAAGVTFRAYPPGVVTSAGIARPSTRRGRAGFECAVGPHRGAIAKPAIGVAAHHDPARRGAATGGFRQAADEVQAYIAHG